MFNKRVLDGYGEDILCDNWGVIPQIGDQANQFDFGNRRFSRREWNQIIWECEKKTRNALRKKRGER